MHAVRGVETGLVVLVPEANPVVGKWRKQLDQVAAEGLGAHITLLFPFAATDEIDADMLHRMENVASATAPLRFELTRVGWFGEHAVWLRADPSRGLIDLIEKLQASFPDYPRYEGAHDEIIPHVSIGMNNDVDAMRVAAEAVAKQLPVQCEAAELSLVVRDSTTKLWKVGRSFPFERSVR